MAAIAASGVVLGAIYMLWLYRKTMFGEIKEECKTMRDLNGRELICLSVLSIGVIVLGLYPNMIFRLIDVPVETIIQQVSR